MNLTIIKRGNTYLVTARIRNRQTGIYPIDGVGTVTVETEGGQELIEASSFAYEADSDGVYHATVQTGTALDSSEKVIFNVLIVAGGLIWGTKRPVTVRDNRDLN